MTKKCNEGTPTSPSYAKTLSIQLLLAELWVSNASIHEADGPGCCPVIHTVVTLVTSPVIIYQGKVEKCAGSHWW